MKKLLILLLLLVPLGCTQDDGTSGDDGGTSNVTTITGDENFTAQIVKISVDGMV